jgi:hypothetical protein
LKLYGSEKKCKSKGVEFKTRVQLACELIGNHVSRAKRTICMWDSWFMCQDTVAKCRGRGYSWIGEIKRNRIVFFEGKKYHLSELADYLRSEGNFEDVAVEGEDVSSLQGGCFHA